MNSLEGKTAMVTGGSSGIGLEIARTFLDAGARVLIVARRQAGIEEALDQLGPRAVGIAGDLSELSTHDAVAARAAKEFGALDIYIANAGVIRTSAAEAVNLDDYDVQFDSNARSAFFGVQKITPIMRDGGCILLTSSIVTNKLFAEHIVYAGSKAAINSFARAFAIELAPRRIRVNVLSPGPTDTPIVDKMVADAQERKGLEAQLSSAIPLGRLAHPTDLAMAALFLASDAASFITGINLPVDGGLSAT